MDNLVAQCTSVLSRTPDALGRMVAGLPQDLLARDEGAGTWSALVTVGHLAYAERTAWLPRIAAMLEPGPVVVLAPFDREGHLAEDQGRGVEDLLDEFARRRAANLSSLAGMSLGPEQLARTAVHPTFGEVTLAQLLATWAAHDLTHLHQVTRVIAYQFRDDVGPWRAFLGVMRCGARGVS